MPVTLIPQNTPKDQIALLQQFPLKDQYNICNIDISEMFGDTIQGEGINAGVPATFIRLQGCTLKCTWCDTLDVWPNGNSYKASEIFWLLDQNGLIEKLRNGQHLVLTGGSPLKQQDSLITFIRLFITKYGFKPYIEVENECVLDVETELIGLVDCWNNSPKLENSGMKVRVRYKSEIIKKVANFGNSWFKFVVASKQDWEEIAHRFLDTHLIKKNQVILMPEGQSQEELERSREIVADICIKEGIRFSDRLHITIWNKKTGV